MFKKTILGTALCALVLLTVGSAVATAHGGRGPGGGPGGPGGGPASVSKLVTEAAKQLNVSRSTLATAITNAGIARIDEAVADEDIEAADAPDLKDDAHDNLNTAYALSRPAKVASNLGITTEKLNDAFKDARRVLALASVDKALAAGDLDAAEAADLKADINEATFPGYKPTLTARGAFGFGPGGAGKHGPRGGGGAAPATGGPSFRR